MSDGNGDRDLTDFTDAVARAVVERVSGEQVTVVQSGVREMTAGSADVRQSGVQSLKAGRVTMEQSAVASARVREARIQDSAVVNLTAGSVSGERIRTVFLISPSVKGNVQAIVTPAVAFAFGAGYFLARRIVGGLLGRGR